MCDEQRRGGEGEGMGTHWWRCDSLTEWSQKKTVYMNMDIWQYMYTVEPL